MEIDDIKAIEFNELANDICGKIQDGYTLNVHLENGSGWVTVSTAAIMDVLPDDLFDDETMSQKVIVATSYVNEFLPDFDKMEEIFKTEGYREGEKTLLKVIEEAKTRWQEL